MNPIVAFGYPAFPYRLFDEVYVAPPSPPAGDDAVFNDGTNIQFNDGSLVEFNV